jgi:hypothetical protein
MCKIFDGNANRIYFIAKRCVHFSTSSYKRGHSERSEESLESAPAVVCEWTPLVICEVLHFAQDDRKLPVAAFADL